MLGKVVLMASGGARARSGPAPDPNALRRDRKDDASWTVLPAEGRKAKAPEFPLPDVDGREFDLWVTLWAMPQALLWEHNAQVLEVAIHCRTFFEAEKFGASSGLRTLVRQQMDALLLTIPSMNAARIRIGSDEVAVKRAELEAPKRVSARDRLKAI
jgi:hypothetical protein